ncbi:MAG: R3H domain-containing nucleic acid-binding protein [Patescibacteria group bacterium]|nr:R3H domain-containing nucleic acid-binding protein [Patescibacteria group bacterium]
MEKEDLEKIKRISEEFFKKTSLNIEAEVLSLEGKTVPINLKTEEPRLLIGQNGQTLNEIQHLLRVILRKEIEGEFYINLDINDYKKRKIEYLKESVKHLADQAISSKQEKTLMPMSAYERRIVHLELIDRQDITTESIGSGVDRRIVLRPYV